MIIDFHTHIFPPALLKKKDELFTQEPGFKSLYRSPESRLVEREELLKAMDEEGVDRCVVLGFPWEKSEHFQRHNDYIIESVQRYPERLIGFACFSPLSSIAYEETVRCLETGLSGVGELAMYHATVPFGAVSNLESVMHVSSRFNAPVLFHTNEPVGHEYPGKIEISLKDLYGFIKKYPENRIILAHWGAGLFFYGTMKKEVREVLRNVWFDTAASPFLYGPEIYRIAQEIIGEEKILFGSDYPLISPTRYFKEMEIAGLKGDSLRKICGENAARLLGISG